MGLAVATKCATLILEESEGITREDGLVSTLFWSAAASMAALLIARWLVPKVAPESRLALWLTARVSLGLEDPVDDDRPAET